MGNILYDSDENFDLSSTNPSDCYITSRPLYEQITNLELLPETEFLNSLCGQRITILGSSLFLIEERRLASVGKAAEVNCIDMSFSLDLAEWGILEGTESLQNNTFFHREKSPVREYISASAVFLSPEECLAYQQTRIAGIPSALKVYGHRVPLFPKAIENQKYILDLFGPFLYTSERQQVILLQECIESLCVGGSLRIYPNPLLNEGQELRNKIQRLITDCSYDITPDIRTTHPLIITKL